MEAWQPGQNQAYTLQSDAQEFFIKMTAWIDLNCWGFWEEVWYGLVRTTALSTRHCIYCKTPRVPHEETLYVQPCSIPANARHVRLTTLIHDYYSPLSSGNQIPDVVCESCKRKGAQITMVARVYPDILPVYIQRFGSTRTGRNIVTHKNRCRVDIPEILDLSRYLEGKVKKAAVFELMSTVQHMGDIETGHYKMFGRQPDNTWLACEDSCVTSAKFYQAVEKADEWDPYLLFYRRLPQSGRIRAMTTTAVAVAEQKDKKEKENKKKKTKEKEGKKEQGKKDKEMKDKKKRKASELPDGKTETPGKKQKSRKKVLV
ncbi:MAG: hypothetical protein MMC33_002621 [Icmadophila ericetorum]|nr:hypothetical protein [Icmadophila ericetorum]